MKGLLDFLQAASNGVASNVSGPVDLIGAGLNRIGLNVGAAPVGGSEWMKRKGLMRDVEPGAAKVLGETAGLLGPAMVSHFAPQIAKGLLQVEANAMAPAKLNKEAGAINVKALEDAFPDVDFSLMQRGDVATLSKVVVPKSERGNGTGTRFMTELTKAADDDGARLALSPSADFGGSKARLIEFYKRFGFVPNKGRGMDFEISESMRREPRK